MRAFSSPICTRCLRNASRIRRLMTVQVTAITGTTAKMISVSPRLIFARITKDITIFTPAMKNSSGQ